jgi:hypothetical protein
MIKLYFAPRTRAIRMAWLLDERFPETNAYLDRLMARPAFQVVAALD